MTSIQPVEQSPSSMSTFDYAPASLLRFNSARVAPEKPDNESESTIPSPPTSPTDLQVNEQLFSFDDSPSKLSIPKHRVHPTSRISPLNQENHNERLVKVSEYRLTENPSFESLTPDKLHRYILLAPRTIFSLSLVTTLSIIVVLIGFGVVVSNRQSLLAYQCPSISYCPKNTSYSLICNITTEYCQCYNTADQLIGCLTQRKYGQGCYRSQECSMHQNTQCNLSIYQCQCYDHYYYNGNSCIPMLTYNQTCVVSNSTCDSALNLICSNDSYCTCDTKSTFWNGEFCEVYRSVNAPCDPYISPSGCTSTLQCNNSSATCQCSASTYYNGESACLTYSSYLQPCYDSTTCLPNSQLLCLWGVCQCDDSYYYWSPSALACVYPQQTQYNSSCSYPTSCESDFGLRCINGRCQCENSFYWTAGNYCDSQSQYNEQCLTTPCLAYTGLICSSNTSTCTCPQYYFWDGYVCQYQRTYSAFCQADSWCRTDVGLRCLSYACSCSVCTTCFWDGIRCRDCPTSWQIVVSNGTIQPRVYCYYKVTSYVNWNESAAFCSSAATSYYGNTSHLIYIDDYQELKDASIFATSAYYDVLIGHTNQFNYSQWFLTNGTVSPSINWCPNVTTIYSLWTCARLLVSRICVTNIICYGWTSRYICELD